MRIISGAHKGRRLTVPNNLPVRPTTDFVKEALFSILDNSYDMEGLTAIDLFSGTGSISYEFASRGAYGVVAVDSHHACIRHIKRTVALMKLDGVVRVLRSNAFMFLKRSPIVSDVIFADPPYDTPLDNILAIADLTFEHRWLSDRGTLIIEHSKNKDLSTHPGYLMSRNYSDSVLSFFK